MNKRNIALLTAITAVGGGIIFAGSHFAAAAGTTPTSTTLSQAIAQKLNVNATDVQTAITSYQDSQRASRQADQRQQYEDRLTQAVTDGKLTADQKTKLLAEYDSVQTSLSALETQEQQIRTDEQTWASTNNIDTQYLPMMGGPGGGHGRGGPGGPMM